MNHESKLRNSIHPNEVSSTPERSVGSVSRQMSDGAKTAASVAKNRIEALDFTKGALVLFMVLYHWLNYFIGPGGITYRFLRFLPPSFIFITGFLISNAYLSRYTATDSRISKRLLVRGFKILGLFVALNVAIGLLVTGFGNLSIVNYLAVFVSGNVHIVGVGKAVAFYILVPISYLLFLSAILLIPYRFFKYTFHVVLLLCVVAILVLSVLGYRSNNLELVTVGLLGLSLGFSPVEKINSYVGHTLPLVAAYICYTAILCFWEPNFLVHTAGVCLTVMLLYLLGSARVTGSLVGKQIILLGRYPLFAYIVQIAILQAMRRALVFVDLGIGQLVLTFVAAAALTLLSVIVLDWIRERSPVADGFYKFIFA
jgi:hypothetical protein